MIITDERLERLETYVLERLLYFTSAANATDIAEAKEELVRHIATVNSMYVTATVTNRFSIATNNEIQEFWDELVDNDSGYDIDFIVKGGLLVSDMFNTEEIMQLATQFKLLHPAIEKDTFIEYNSIDDESMTTILENTDLENQFLCNRWYLFLYVLGFCNPNTITDLEAINAEE